MFKKIIGGLFGTGKPKKISEESVEELKKRLSEDNPTTLMEYYKLKKRR